MTKRKKVIIHEEARSRFPHLDELHLGGIERDLKAGKYVEPEVLTSALREHGSRPIPPDVLDYICRMLEGNVRRPRGRPELPEIDKRQWHMTIRVIYRRNLTWLQTRKAKYGSHTGWTNLEGTPAEIAARMVGRCFYHGAESGRRIQNISSQK